MRTWATRIVLLYALWLLLVGTVNRLQLVAGAVALVLALGGLLAARRQLPRYRVDPRLLGGLVRLPWELLRDSLVVLAAIPRRTTGRFRSTSFPTGESPTGRGARAFAEARGSLAPNSIVVDVDPERGLVLLHELDRRVPGKPS
ncbi:MAG TPA: Na+/H+ antiporter subunit E [Gaiellaceae bacterium]|nr:Na+/H+ antiporter subunit E [Gaiellaceae bacterium]